jgi:hypothetical protein
VSAISSASLIVALSDLKLVQSVIGAMRAADINVAAEVSTTGSVHSPAATYTPTQAEFSPAVALRQHIYSLPVIEPRTVIHSHPRIEFTPAPAPAPTSLPCGCDSHPKSAEPTFQPPWHVLPWPQHDTETRRIKSVVAPPDILVKGLLIDLFM